MAKTVKGKGFSDFESLKFSKDLKFYPFHSGAVPEKLYLNAINEILLKIKNFSKKKKIKNLITKKKKITQIKKSNKNLNLIQAYSEALYKLLKIIRL